MSAFNDTEYLKKAKLIVEAYSNENQARIIHLLKIYGKLSTKELEEKMGKAKTTVLRHLNNLIDLNLVRQDEVHEGRGRYPTKYFSIIERDMKLQGQKLRLIEDYKPTRKDYEQYMRSFQSQYILAREVLDQSVQYFDRIIEELYKKKYTDADIDNLLKDNLGMISFQYLKKSTVWKRQFDKEPERYAKRNEFLQLNLLLPIRRLVEQMASNEWKIESDIWYYED